MTAPERPLAGWLVPALSFAFLASLLAGCGGDGSPTSPPPPASTPVPPATVRDRLTVAELFGSSPPGVLHNLYYQPIGAVRPTSNALCGTLHFAETRMDTAHPDSDWRGSGQTLFPAFSLPVLTRDDWLIPLERDLILSGHGGGGSGRSLWNVIADPGRVWEEAADAGYSRAAFPFTFTDNFVGQARNGLATFVFDRLGVSPMAVQITQETAPQGEHVRADFSALVPLRWDPECPAGAEAAAAAFTRERAARLPLHPWSDLPNAQAATTTTLATTTVRSPPTGRACPSRRRPGRAASSFGPSPSTREPFPSPGRRWVHGTPTSPASTGTWGACTSGASAARSEPGGARPLRAGDSRQPVRA